MNKLRVWRFYLKPKSSSSSYDYRLYAITNNKKFAREFMNSRKMDRFIVKQTDELKDDYADAANENLGAVLNYYNLTTFYINPEDKNQTTGKKEVSVLMTLYEYQSVNADETVYEVLTLEWWINMPEYPLFNDRICDALRILEYVSAQRFFLQDDDDFYFLLMYLSKNQVIDMDYEQQFATYDDGDYAVPDLSIDELGVFIKTYADILKN